MAPLPGVGLGAVDIQEPPNAYIFKVDVPGLSKDDVKGALPDSVCNSAWFGMLVAMAVAEASLQASRPAPAVWLTRARRRAQCA